MQVPFIDADVPSIVERHWPGGALVRPWCRRSQISRSQLGTGGAWLVRLPTSFDPKAAPMLANDLNLLEASGSSPSKLTGAGVRPTQLLNFDSFLPSYVA